MQNAAMNESKAASPEAGVLLLLWRHRGILLMALDAVTIVGLFIGVYYLRFRYQFLAIKYEYTENVQIYIEGGAVLALAWVMFNWQSSVYRSDMRGVASLQERIRRLLVSGFKALVVLTLLSFLSRRGLMLSRQVYLMSGVLAFLALATWRLVLARVEVLLWAKGIALQRILVVGADAQTTEFVRSIEESRTPVTVIGFLAMGGEDLTHLPAHKPVFGSIDDLEAVHERERFDKIAMSHDVMTQFGSLEGGQRLIEIVNFCEARDIALYALPNVVSIAIRQDEVGVFAGIPVVRVRDAALHPAYAALKRVIDIVIATLVLVLGLPAWIAIALIIKFTSKGPVLFTQQRVGLHGKLFKIYKFRSMSNDAEARLKELVDINKLEVPGFKIKGDPRVTKVGAFLRRTSLDEIPQILNVLKGDMSCVGPRPEMPQLVERYNPSQRRRLKAKPGMTGWGQVMARGVPLAAAVDYDLYYLKHQGFLLDMYILFKTVIVVLRGSGVTH
jgi:exopolysaccharide biosynthesis polyprenyl glycosylphosphotransferase